MLKLFIAATILLSQAVTATSIYVKDNSDIALTLSKSNYNRLVIKGDKIIEANFPPTAMGIKSDAQDGSVYVMLANPNPFTLFLTTEAGRHFSVTLSSEEALGKTIELIPQPAVVAKATTNTRIIQPVASIPNAVVSMIAHMEQHKPINGVTVKHQFGRVERMQSGLTLLPKESWEGQHLKGEIIEVYNGGRQALNLAESWFVNANVKAIKLSQNILAPKARAILYRVQERDHG